MEEQIQQAFLQFAQGVLQTNSPEETILAIQQLDLKQQQLLLGNFIQYLQLIVESPQSSEEDKLTASLMLQAIQLSMQQGQVAAARFGAKIQYLGSLRGQCPEGTELRYFKAGGKVCKKCVKKAVSGTVSGHTSKNPIKAFKHDHCCKKHAQGGAIIKGQKGFKSNYNSPNVFF